MEDKLFQDNKGICLVCAGHTEGDCFCSSIQEGSNHSQEFISFNSDPTTQQSTTIPHYQRSKKDNIALKRFATILKKAYIKITGKAIPEDIKTYYHRKDFFIMILNLFEREGKLEEGWALFDQNMQKFTENIQNQYQDEPQYLQYLLTLIPTHIKAFKLFKEGEVTQAVQTIYDYNIMRHRTKFYSALKLIFKMRIDMGLPF